MRSPSLWFLFFGSLMKIKTNNMLKLHDVKSNGTIDWTLSSNRAPANWVHFPNMCSISHYSACSFFSLFLSLVHFFPASFCCCHCRCAHISSVSSLLIQVLMSLRVFSLQFFAAAVAVVALIHFQWHFLIIIQSIVIKTHNGQSRRNNMEQTVINQQAVI